MTLLEQTYRTLKEAGLVSSAEAFSTDYLGKCKSWYAFQKHTGRDFSVSAAIHCLRSMRRLQAGAFERGTSNKLARASEQLGRFLLQRHHVERVK